MRYLTGKYLALILTILMLQGCSSGYAPVTDRSISYSNNVEIVRSSKAPQKKQETRLPDRYTVKKGDTLYSIAWRYRLDYRDLAKQNGIDQSYRIYVGQRLNLKGRAEATQLTKASAGNQSKSKSPFIPDDGKSIVPKVATTTKTAVSKKAPSTKKPKSNQKPTKNTSTKKKASSKTDSDRKKGSVSKKTAAKIVNEPVSSSKIQWRWPAKGRMIQGYSVKGSVNKGINLAGKKGDPIYSAAEGRVVYAGNGLLGYGNLIIINHNQDFLSAYAHNSRILVTEGANVKKSQKIAEMGSSGATRVMLHFEIRKDGKPVNPLKYLPRR